MRKLNILFTGCTSIQLTDVRRGSISKIDVPASIVEALRDRGHTVDWRRVHPGEDLSAYDVAWVNIAPIGSFNGRIGALGTLWVLSAPLPVVTFFDDWQLGTNFSSMEAELKKPEFVTKYMVQGDNRGRQVTHYSLDAAHAVIQDILNEFPDAKPKLTRYYPEVTDEVALKHRDRLHTAAAQFSGDRWARGMVAACPMYTWGDTSIIQRLLPAEVSPLVAIDASPTITPLLLQSDERIPMENKDASWALGSLMPHDKWLEKRNLTWPVDIFGSNTMIRKLGGTRLKTELDVLNVYNRYAGILSPPYKHAGSGWWRSRFIYSARTRSVLACENGEGAPLGEPYCFTSNEIEELSTAERAYLADAQADALRPHMTDINHFADVCEATVLRAINEDQGALA